jgi:hypothetical protein
VTTLNLAGRFKWLGYVAIMRTCIPENLKEISVFEELGIDGRIIL